VVVHRPREEVFGYLTDLETWSRWQPGLWESEQTSRGSMDVGTTFRLALDVSSQRIEVLCEVTEYEENEKLEFHYARDGLSLGLGYYLEPVGDYTRITGKGEGRMSGFSGLFEPIVDREVNEHIKTSLKDLKSLLESRVPEA
jgi:carbon monoxide dehydrogenase subunit G